jgi:hypothetical protein
LKISCTSGAANSGSEAKKSRLMSVPM